MVVTICATHRCGPFRNRHFYKLLCSLWILIIFIVMSFFIFWHFFFFFPFFFGIFYEPLFGLTPFREEIYVRWLSWYGIASFETEGVSDGTSLGRGEWRLCLQPRFQQHFRAFRQPKVSRWCSKEAQCRTIVAFIQTIVEIFPWQIFVSLYLNSFRNWNKARDEERFRVNEKRAFE